MPEISCIQTCFIGQEFFTSFEYYEDAKLYYWTREAKNTNAEIDFVFQIENKFIPLKKKQGKQVH